jgi:hypothetical protein
MEVMIFTLGLLVGVTLGFVVRGRISEYNKKQYFYRRVYNPSRRSRSMGFT